MTYGIPTNNSYPMNPGFPQSMDSRFYPTVDPRFNPHASHSYPSQHAPSYSFGFDETSHSRENVDQPKSWKEGAEKIKDQTKGFFSNIGKTFKKVFSKKVFTPILGFFGRSVIDTIGQVFSHVSKMIIPMITKENALIYNYAAEAFFTQLGNFAKENLPKVEPLDPQVDAMFTGILNSLQGGLHQFRQESYVYGFEKRKSEMEQEIAELKRKEQELQAERKRFEEECRRASSPQGASVPSVSDFNV